MIQTDFKVVNWTRKLISNRTPQVICGFFLLTIYGDTIIVPMFNEQKQNAQIKMPRHLACDGTT